MGRIRQTAHAQAKAEYAPQRSSVRREERSQARSLRSMQPALLGSIATARRQLRHSGLSPRDLAIAESELAHRSADVGASTALQLGELHRAAGEQLVDLSQGQSQAERGLMATLQQEAQKRQQEIADQQRGHVEDFKYDILKAQALDKLGLSDSGSSGGLTPTQERSHNQSQHTAAYWASQYAQLARKGVKDENGEWEVPPVHPGKAPDSFWQEMVGHVASKKGVASVTDAQHAVQAIRDHFEGRSGAPQNSVLAALIRLASQASGLDQVMEPVQQALTGRR